MEALHLLINAGFVIHWVKYSLKQLTDFPFLGFQWNMVQVSVAIPQVKEDALHSQAKILSNLTSPTCRQIMVLTGLIAAFFKAFPLLPLKGRWLQTSLNSVYSSELDLQKSVILSSQTVIPCAKAQVTPGARGPSTVQESWFASVTYRLDNCFHTLPFGHGSHLYSSLTYIRLRGHFPLTT
jgi:hypothetical protein